jgi:hypothetical protein
VHATATMPIVLRSPTLLERLAAILAHTTSYAAGKLLARSNEFRAIARRAELEAEMQVTVQRGRDRAER